MVLPIVCASGIRASKSIILNRYFLGAVLFELLFFIPLGIYLFYFHPDWSLMYFVDSASYSETELMMTGLGAISAYMASALLGFFLASRLVRDDKMPVALVIMAVFGVGMGIFSLLTWDRLFNVATYDIWLNRPEAAASLLSHHIGYIVGVDSTVAGIFLLLMIRAMKKAEADVA